MVVLINSCFNLCAFTRLQRAASYQSVCLQLHRSFDFPGLYRKIIVLVSLMKAIDGKSVKWFCNTDASSRDDYSMSFFLICSNSLIFIYINIYNVSET